MDAVHAAADSKDDSLGSFWLPSPANESRAWCQWDTGALKIIAGCRVYWGAEAGYLLNAYRIQLSEDGTNWNTVATETVAPPTDAWKEYSWKARYARYIRLMVDSHGASGTKIYEIDYYSRITDRVAAEHGHRSGITPHLHVRYCEGHPEMALADTLRQSLGQSRHRLGLMPTVSKVIEYLDAQTELIDFLLRRE
jgi:hypothetical protein